AVRRARLLRQTDVRYLRPTEVQHLYVASEPDHYVLGLDIAVHYANSMRGDQSVGDLHRHIQCVVYGERSVRQTGPQRLALDVLGGHEVRAICPSNLVNGQNVWVIKSGGRARFPAKARDLISIIGEECGKKLQRDAATEARVLSQIDASHASRAQQRNNLVARDRLSD